MGFNEKSKESDKDPILNAFLALIGRDISEHPANLIPISEEQIKRVEELTNCVQDSD